MIWIAIWEAGDYICRKFDIALTSRNRWLQNNGQFKHCGVDVEAFIAGASATATAEALSTHALTLSPVQLALP